MNKMWLRSKRCFSLVRVLIKAWLRDKIRFFWLNCNPIHFTWKFAGTVFALTENWVENIPKTSYEFFRNLENYSQVPLSTWKTRVYVFLLPGLNNRLVKSLQCSCQWWKSQLDTVSYGTSSNVVGLVSPFPSVNCPSCIFLSKVFLFPELHFYL